MANVKKLENNITKLDVMIKELEKRLQALETSKVLMKEKISTLKFHERLVKIKHVVKLDKIIDGIQKRYS